MLAHLSRGTNIDPGVQFARRDHRKHRQRQGPRACGRAQRDEVRRTRPLDLCRQQTPGQDSFRGLRKSRDEILDEPGYSRLAAQSEGARLQKIFRAERGSSELDAQAHGGFFEDEMMPWKTTVSSTPTTTWYAAGGWSPTWLRCTTRRQMRDRSSVAGSAA